MRGEAVGRYARYLTYLDALGGTYAVYDRLSWGFFVFVSSPQGISP